MAGANVWGKKNAWGVAEEVVEEPIVSFVDIMSEELVNQIGEECVPGSSTEEVKYDNDEDMARALQEQFDREMEVAAQPARPATDAVRGTPGKRTTSITEYKDDEEMARALQREFDREIEMAELLEQSKKTPGKLNSVAVAADRYCPTTRQYRGDENDDDSFESDEEDMRELNTNKKYEKMNEALGPFIGGLMRTPNGDVMSKHDPSIVSTKNVERVMNGSIDVPTGDCYSVDMNSGGNVFNKLRSFAKTEQKRINRLKDKEEKATIETSVDAVTRLTLFKWINQGLFDRVEGIVATGKESAVLSAEAHSLLEDDQPYFLAIKVYKTTLTDFKNRGEYVVNDFRFKNPRRVMRIWAEKEFMNLTRMFNKQLPCPEPIKLRKHIMVMGFIGDDQGIPAPKLRNVQFDEEAEKISAFEQTKNILLRMYKECNLVHGDFSEFNLLYKDGVVYVIDVSQAMDLSHPRVLHYLLRDIENVLLFFNRHETPNLPSHTALFNEITDLSMSEEGDLSCQVEEFEACNRNTQLRIDKSKPADLELRKMQSEQGSSQLAAEYI
ncbi:riok-3 [Pristionchus pacificus]|nr:riok-3 [Pristionchus pacificus]